MVSSGQGRSKLLDDGHPQDISVPWGVQTASRSYLRVHLPATFWQLCNHLLCCFSLQGHWGVHKPLCASHHNWGNKIAWNSSWHCPYQEIWPKTSDDLIGPSHGLLHGELGGDGVPEGGVLPQALHREEGERDSWVSLP